MRLLVIVPDYLSAIIKKGEIQPRYFNPGNLADDVHILMTNDDKPPLAPLQYMVGDATLHLHNLPVDHKLPTRRFAFLTPWRLKRWAKPGVEMIRRINPDIIRCHNADWCAFIAALVKLEMGIPYCISFHGNPDIDFMGGRIIHPKNDVDFRRNMFFDYMERTGVLNADLVLPVYKSILSFFQKYNLENNKIQLSYNVLNGHDIVEKNDYRLHRPAKLVWVSRMCPDEKDPENVIRSLVGLDNLTCTFVGDGPLRTMRMELTKTLGLETNALFIASVLNSDLCRTLHEYDLFVVQCDVVGISKAVIEALLTGLPVIINRCKGESMSEFEEGDFVRLVDNTPESYRTAIQELIEDHSLREALGRRAFAYAHARWDPKITEAAYVDVYRMLLEKRRA